LNNLNDRPSRSDSVATAFVQTPADLPITFVVGDESSKPERIEEVVKVMREEAAARGLPFLDIAGRLLVKRAISNARKAAAGS
jgi:hypothetical protein